MQEERYWLNKKDGEMERSGQCKYKSLIIHLYAKQLNALVQVSQLST